MDAEKLDELFEAWFDGWLKRQYAMMPPDWVKQYGDDILPSYGEVFAAGYHSRDSEKMDTDRLKNI